MVNIINEQGKVERLSLNLKRLLQALSSQLYLARLEALRHRLQTVQVNIHKFVGF